MTLCSKYTRALTFENLCQALQPRERERERERETHPSPPLSTGGGVGGGGGGDRHGSAAVLLPVEAVGTEEVEEWRLIEEL